MEIALGREPLRFMDILITSDPLHANNHTACSKSFNSSIYPNLSYINKEACEQFNSLLRSVESSVSYMTYDNYLQAIKIVISLYK